LGGGNRTSRLWGERIATDTLGSMEHQITAEEMPSLYRAVLDAVWRLERMGDRDVALAIRRRAVNTYATRWDDGGRKELAKIHRDAVRRLAIGHPAAGSALEATSEAL